MHALDIPSASDLERVERRLRSFSQRLEEVEEQIDDAQPRARRVRRQLAKDDERKAKKTRKRQSLTLDFRVRVRCRGAFPAHFAAGSIASSSRRSPSPPR